MFRREQDALEETTAHGTEMPTRKRVLLRTGEVPHITQLATSRSWDGCDTAEDPHVHPTMWELYFVRAGRATFTIDGDVHEAEPGSFLAVPPNTTHSYVVAPGDVLELLYLGVAIDKP